MQATCETRGSEGAPQRRLLWVPVIHTEADLGSMSEAVRQVHVRSRGKSHWERRLQTVEQLWQQTRQAIDGLDLNYPHVCLYQDGLPNSGHEVEIVRDLAQAGSLNHQLVLELMSRGARLIGTESPELLLEEYQLAQQVLAALAGRQGRVLARRQHELSQALLDRRDEYIARRIAETLPAGDTGLIFLGMCHSLEGRLPADVIVTRLQPTARPGGKSHDTGLRGRGTQKQESGSSHRGAVTGEPE